MNYQAELEFLQKTLDKARVQTKVLKLGEVPEEALDYGLRKFLGLEEEYALVMPRLSGLARENTIYKLTDDFCCNYMFLVLPHEAERRLLLIGPYVAFRLSRQQILEIAEDFRLAPAYARQLEDYYTNIPLIADDSVLFLMINAFAERLWGKLGAYEIVDVNQESESRHHPRHALAHNEPIEEALLQMKIMEKRYSYENELMENVSRGLAHRAERMMHRVSQEIMKPRVADPIRNMKNYCIICNTLLRKAAEQGGVHPFHLDKLSSQFAVRIEAIPNYEAGQTLMVEMTRAYCRQVRKKSMKHYSPLIRNVVSYIEAELSGDLRLSTLAAEHSINPSYLSALFKKETGKTVTEFVNEKRMELGMQLLTTSRLQIQTVAQHCGLPDANYFSKLFKKHFGMTPKQYREQSDLQA